MMSRLLFGRVVEPVELRTLVPNTVFRVAGTGEVGYVQRRVPSRGGVLVRLEDRGSGEQVNALVPGDTRVVVEADGRDLALAYVLRPSVRALVEAALGERAAALHEQLFERAGEGEAKGKGEVREPDARGAGRHSGTTGDVDAADPVAHRAR